MDRIPITLGRGKARPRARGGDLALPRAGASRGDAAFAVGIVLLLGAAIRLAMLETLPLVVTPDALWYPDGRGYLVWADELRTRGELAGPPLRTPGYPLLLAGAFAIGGVRDHAVLGLQHLIGLATVALITWVAAKRAGPRVALVTGALASLDPWHLLFAHYALTETTAAFFTVASAAAVLLAPTRSPGRGLVVGLLAGAACLVRPSNQLLVPFVAAAFLLLGRPPRPRLAAAGVALALGLAASLGPWLAFNATRGIRGLAVQRDGVLFVSMVFHRLLDARDMPADAPEPVRRTFGESAAAREPPSFADRFLRISASSGLTHEQRQSWSRRSLVRNLRRYPAAAWETLRTLLDVGRPGHPPIPDELLAFVARLTTEPKGSTLQESGIPSALPTRRPLLPASLAQGVHAGLARAFDLASWHRGIPQVPLALLAGVTLSLCRARRRYAEMALLAGSLAFVAAHALLLYPHQRFTLPSQMLWYLAVPLLYEALVRDRGPGTRPSALTRSSSRRRR